MRLFCLDVAFVLEFYRILFTVASSALLILAHSSVIALAQCMRQY